MGLLQLNTIGRMGPALAVVEANRVSQLEHYNYFAMYAHGANPSADGNTYLYGRNLGWSARVVRKLITGQVIVNRGLVTTVNANYLVERVFTTTTTDLIFIEACYTLTSGKHYLLRSDDGGLTFTQVMAFGEGNDGSGGDTLAVSAVTDNNFLEITTAYPGGGGVGDLYIGEYNGSVLRVSGGNNDRVRLMKSTDHGATWAAVMTWNTAGHQTRHIHSIFQDPYTGHIYICLGDEDTECGIIRWDGATAWTDNSTPATIGTWSGFASCAGHQNSRAVGLIITPNYIISGSDTDIYSDAPGTYTGIWRWSKNLSAGVRVSNDIRAYDPTHVIWSGVNLNGTLMFRCVRQTHPSDGFYWTEPSSLIYMSIDEGATWYRAGLEMHSADPTKVVSAFEAFTWVYNNKLYIDSTYGLDYAGTEELYISGKTFHKGSSPVVVHPVYYVGDWNVPGVDLLVRGRNPDTPVATSAYLTGTIGITTGARVRANPHTPITGIWLSDGITASTVIAAYHARGATSYAASKVNLVAPGTHNLLDGATAPGWNVATGWNASSSGYLISDILPTATMFVIAKYSGIVTAGNYDLFGASTGANYFMMMPLKTAGNIRPWWGGYATSIALANSGANIIGLGPQVYWLNQQKGSFSGTWGAITYPLYVMAFANNGVNPAYQLGQGYVEALYIYDPMPTDAQVLAVDNAMRALFP